MELTRFELENALGVRIEDICTPWDSMTFPEVSEACAKRLVEIAKGKGIKLRYTRIGARPGYVKLYLVTR